jgi:hypothetical protein
MEAECSLPCSQEPATGPYPEPDESSPCRFYTQNLLTLFVTCNKKLEGQWIRMCKTANFIWPIYDLGCLKPQWG